MPLILYWIEKSFTNILLKLFFVHFFYSVTQLTYTYTQQFFRIFLHFHVIITTFQGLTNSLTLFFLEII